MKQKCTQLLLICALSAPMQSVHAATDDVFGMMFRMMLTMMNVMSGAMLNNNNGLGNNSWGNNNWLDNWNNGLGGFNSFNLGMSALPMMSGMGTPWSSFGGSPWSGFGGSPWTSSPWSGFGGSNPWNNLRGNPFSNGYGYPGGYYPGIAGPGRSGYPANYGAYRRNIYSGDALLDGRWYGSSGEILEIRANRFRLQAGNITLNGVIKVINNIVNMFSPQTNTVTRYTFVRNQYGLLLQGINGEVLQFTNNPVNGVVHVF